MDEDKKTIRIYTHTPKEMVNYLIIPKSSHTRKKVEKIGKKLEKVIKTNQFFLYHCPGFNSRIYYNGDNTVEDTIKRVVKLSNNF